MEFTDRLSRLPIGKALPASHHDEEFFVASTNKNRSLLTNLSKFIFVKRVILDRPSVAVNSFVNTHLPSGTSNSSYVIGPKRTVSSSASLKLRTIAATNSCIAKSIKIC